MNNINVFHMVFFRDIASEQKKYSTAVQQWFFYTNNKLYNNINRLESNRNRRTYLSLLYLVCLSELNNSGSIFIQYP